MPPSSVRLSANRRWKPAVRALSYLALIHTLLAANPALADSTSVLEPGSIDSTISPQPSSRIPTGEGPSLIEIFGHWDNDLIANIHGGIQRGTALDNTAQVGMTIHGEAWQIQGASLHAALFAMHTGHASSRLVGDSLGVSNIEGQRNGLALAAAYWAQQWRPGVTTQVGVFDINSLFDVTDSAGLLLNGSFGLDPTLTGNFGASTFPRSGSGATVDWRQGDLSLTGGIFQGDVIDQSQPFGGGTLGLIETGWHSETRQIKVGLWHKNGGETRNLSGIYVSGEQTMPTRQLTGFVRAGYAHSRRNHADVDVNRYLGAGLHWQGPLTQRPGDSLDFGIGDARLQNQSISNQNSGQSHERVIELAYVIRLNRHLYLQPDLQYIEHPSGQYPSAWVTTLRLHIE